jgi:N-acetylglucosamine kinase-like BadF-type ATPase
MSDGRAPRTALYELIRDRFHLHVDLDLCAVVYGPPPMTRSKLAALAPLVARAAQAGDESARQLFEQAAEHLASIVHAVRDQLDVPLSTPLPVSYSGGMFQLEGLLRTMLETSLNAGDRRYHFVAPRLTPVTGAALYAAKLADTVLPDDGVKELERVLGTRLTKDPA